MITAIIDYGSGNLRSVAKAFERVLRTDARDARVAVTGDPAVVRKADRIVLPGVGAFADCMRGLRQIAGMTETLQRRVIDDAVPFLGICVGMQMMSRESEEHGRHAGLGWIPASVARMAPAPGYRIPHMGWNELLDVAPHPVFAGLEPHAHAYFVHSYAVHADQAEHVAARTCHGGPVVAALARDNLIGTQFHPEKSQAIGLRMLANFIRWTP